MPTLAGLLLSVLSLYTFSCCPGPLGDSHLSHKTSVSHIQRSKEAGLGSEGPVQERPLRGARQVWEGEETRISLVLSALLCLQVEAADGKEG